VEFVDLNPPFLEKPDHRWAHLPIYKLSQTVAQFAELLVELLIAPFSLSIALFSRFSMLLQDFLGFLQTAIGFFLGLSQFAQQAPDVISSGSHGYAPGG
jgi:hypothetical protein